MKNQFCKRISILLTLLLTFSLVSYRLTAAPTASNTEYFLGVGMSDITGPPAEIVMMGYANSDQSNRGLHLRQRSRAFVIEHPQTDSRLVYVSTDLGMCFQSIKTGVVERLAALGYSNLYHDNNVMINATHTHSGPGGYSHHGLYNVSTFGFIEENFNGIVEGITTSIIRAHNNLEPGYLEYNSGLLLGQNNNRSKVAYNNNPTSEKNLYDYDVDKEMHLLNFRNSSGNLLGVLNWFAVHATSMTVENLLISSDNKGTASYLFEKEMETDYFSDKTFACAFAQSNCGDVSPPYEGDPASFEDNGMANTYAAGLGQYQFAKQLSDSANQRIAGPLAFRQTYVDMSKENINPLYTNGQQRRTFPGAMGYSFAAGAEDGPSNLPLFKEGMVQPEYSLDNSSNYVKYVQAFVNLAPKFRQINGSRYPELWDQHYPKPILFATSKASPDPWTPQIVPIQMFAIGDFAILGVPAEVTTMSGRRLRRYVGETLKANTGTEYTIVISGHTNSYTSYLTTPEEYDSQQYEGASTQFGKWTLPAYIQNFDTLAVAITSGSVVESGPTPPDLRDEQVTFEIPVIFDNTLAWDDFGDVDVSPRSSYEPGETVIASFWSGHPNNDFRHGDSYLEIQQKINNSWKTIAYDWDIETRYRWKRHSVLLGTSRSTIEWDIPDTIETGMYRIKHNGSYKTISSKIKPYEGHTREFMIYRP